MLTVQSGDSSDGGVVGLIIDEELCGGVETRGGSGEGEDEEREQSKIGTNCIVFFGGGTGCFKSSKSLPDRGNVRGDHGETCGTTSSMSNPGGVLGRGGDNVDESGVEET